MPKKVAKFEVGKNYACRSACDQNCVWEYTIAKRTKCTITTTEGETFRINKRSTAYNNAETVYPKGRYSMAPSITADKVNVSALVQSFLTK